jgi:predicted CoA-substrate-specific enzyme activase
MERNMVFAGIDAGSRAIKVVLVDRERRPLGRGLRDQGVEQVSLAQDILEQTAKNSGVPVEDISTIVATGYGRDALDFAHSTVTEITCHARGIVHQSPEARTVIDIGGQDSKLIRIGKAGRVRDFVMNDRCAAGTGRFLEVVAQRLGRNIEELGSVAGDSSHPAVISSMCVVFAESEIVGLLASGERAENIVAGVQNAIATRIGSMAGRRVEEPIVFTGGVALIPGMIRALEETLGRAVSLADHPQYSGALGAALLALEKASS